MRILLVTKGLRSGGAERVMSVLANYLSARHDVRIIVLHETGTDYPLDENVECVFAAGACFNANATANWIAFQIDEFKPDVTCSFLHGVNTNAIAGRYRARHDAPIVVSERVDPSWATRKDHLVGREMMYPFADGGIFQTDQIEAYYVQNHDMRNTVVLDNPLSPGFDMQPYEGTRTKRIVAVGRLAEEKNQALLIDAFAQIAEEFPQHSLDIYGEGHLREALQKQIGDLGLGGRIALRGRMNDIAKHIQDAELFVHSSNHEGTPNAVIEAMALGLPCVVTDTPYGSCATLVEQGVNALMVPMGDCDALAVAMRRVLNDEALRTSLSQHAVRIVERFRAEAVCPKWERYLADAANDTTRQPVTEELREQAEAAFQTVLNCNSSSVLKQHLSQRQITVLRNVKDTAKLAVNMGGHAVRVGQRFANGLARKHSERADDKPNLTFVIYNLAGGGAERVVVTLANELSETWNVSIAMCEDTPTDYDLSPEVRKICRPNPDKLNSLKHLRSICRALDSAEPDIVVSFLPTMNACAIVSKALLGFSFKVVISERNCPYHAYSNKRSLAINKILYHFADGGVFQTDNALAFWSKSCRKNPVKLPNPLAPGIAAQAIGRGVRERAKKVVSVGRLMEQKNHAQLIEAFADIAAQFPGFVLEIIGTGPLHDDLAYRIERLGLVGRVVLAGRVPNDSIVERTGDAALFVLPSLWEGFPNALIEAMAMGLPCIASDCSIGGPRELIEHGINGLLVKVGDKDELVSAMRQALSDAGFAEKLGESARAVVERFDAHEVAQAWSSYLFEVLSGKPRGGRRDR